MVIGAVTKGSERFKRTYEMVKWLKCFRWFRVRKGMRTFRKRFRSLLKYLWSFQVRKGMGNAEPPEPLCGSRLNTVRLTFHHLDDDCRHCRAPRCFGGLPLPVPPLCQAAAQLGRLASGASHAGPIRTFSRNPRLLAGVVCTFSADQPYRRR